MRAESAPEALLALQLRAAGVVGWEREFRFAPPRRWRLDFAWPALRVAVEIEGGIWVRGRHTRPTGFLRDAEKYNEAALAGWTLLRVVPGQIRSGEALQMIERAVAGAAMRG